MSNVLRLPTDVSSSFLASLMRTARVEAQRRKGLDARGFAAAVERLVQRDVEVSPDRIDAYEAGSIPAADVFLAALEVGGLQPCELLRRLARRPSAVGGAEPSRASSRR